MRPKTSVRCFWVRAEPLPSQESGRGLQNPDKVHKYADEFTQRAGKNIGEIYAKTAATMRARFGPSTYESGANKRCQALLLATTLLRLYIITEVAQCVHRFDGS
jgi:hypothetical protein